MPKKVRLMPTMVAALLNKESHDQVKGSREDIERLSYFEGAA